MDKFTLKYVDKKPIWIPRLKNYPNGITLPLKDKESIISVVEKEKVHLMKMKNGTKNCFEIIDNKKPSSRNYDNVVSEV